MANNILLQMRKFSSIIQQAQVIGLNLLHVVMKEYADYMKVSAIILPKTGSVFSYQLPNETEAYMESLRYNQFRSIYETKENVLLSEYSKNIVPHSANDMKSILIPILASGERIAFLLSYREKEFTDDDIMFTEFVASFAGVMIAYYDQETEADDGRKKMIVKSAINTLSYSELETIIQIFNELDGDEGLVVASKIADHLGITRSICVNALKKFESAGVIESRSLGVKGTFIKIINPYLRRELNKMK